MSNAAVNPFFGNIMDSTEDVWDKVYAANEVPALIIKQKSEKNLKNDLN